MAGFNYNCPKSVIIIVVFMSIMALLFGIRTLYQIVHRKLSCTEKILATIHYKNARGSIGETTERLTAILKYKIDGIEYIEQDIYIVSSREYEEGEVYIFYNPQNPKVFLLPQKNVFARLIISGFIILMGLFFLFAVYKILIG